MKIAVPSPLFEQPPLRGIAVAFALVRQRVKCVALDSVKNASAKNVFANHLNFLFGGG
jgi:hypothetical protein